MFSLIFFSFSTLGVSNLSGSGIPLKVSSVSILSDVVLSLILSLSLSFIILVWVESKSASVSFISLSFLKALQILLSE